MKVANEVASAPDQSVRMPSDAMRDWRTESPAVPCTCSVVLNASIGVIRIRKRAAAHDAHIVFVPSPMKVTPASSASMPALAAVSPKRDSGA